MKLSKLSFLVVSTFMVISCSDDKALRSRANELAQKFIITDGHIDTPWKLSKNYEDISMRTKTGDFDYVRAKEGGLDVPFMAIYIPSSYIESGGAKEKADSLIDMVEQIANKEFEFIGNKNPINTVCESINTIPYEILTNLGKRYQRRYIS